MTLDITLEKKTGKDLSDFISDNVNSRGTFIIGNVPSVVKMTETQYKSLIGIEKLEEMKFINELTGVIKPLEEAKLFYTKQTTDLSGNTTGGYALEVEIVPDAH